MVVAVVEERSGADAAGIPVSLECVRGMGGIGGAEGWAVSLVGSWGCMASRDLEETNGVVETPRSGLGKGTGSAGKEDALFSGVWFVTSGPPFVCDVVARDFDCAGGEAASKW